MAFRWRHANGHMFYKEWDKASSILRVNLTSQPKEISFVVPEAHFLHPDVKAIANLSYKSNK